MPRTSWVQSAATFTPHTLGVGCWFFGSCQRQFPGSWAFWELGVDLLFTRLLPDSGSPPFQGLGIRPGRVSGYLSGALRPAGPLRNACEWGWSPASSRKGVPPAAILLDVSRSVARRRAAAVAGRRRYQRGCSGRRVPHGARTGDGRDVGPRVVGHRQRRLAADRLSSRPAPAPSPASASSGSRSRGCRRCQPIPSLTGRARCASPRLRSRSSCSGRARCRWTPASSGAARIVFPHDPHPPKS